MSVPRFCPECGDSNPPSAVQCVCGHPFEKVFAMDQNRQAAIQQQRADIPTPVTENSQTIFGSPDAPRPTDPPRSLPTPVATPYRMLPPQTMWACSGCGSPLRGVGMPCERCAALKKSSDGNQLGWAIIFIFIVLATSGYRIVFVR